MNVLLLRQAVVRKNGSLQSFNEYRQTESSQQLCSVTSDGLLLEYETLELRLHPPNVQIDNVTHDDVTVITIDSANRPGTLIEVVQCLTELGLSIKRARISSDGGWFVDGEHRDPHKHRQVHEFFVTETPRGKVQDARKLDLIRRLLSVDSEAHQGTGSCSVFELSGRDSSGLLVEVLKLLASNTCDVTSAAVWTFHNRCALVLSLLDRGAPISDSAKAERLQATLRGMLGGEGAVVKLEMVRGDIHHERRLHHLLLLEELRSWEEQQLLTQQLRLPQHSDDPANITSAAAAAASASGNGGTNAGGSGGGAAGAVSGADLPMPGLARSNSWSSVASGHAGAGPSSSGMLAPIGASMPGGASIPGTGPGTASGSEAPTPYRSSASPAPGGPSPPPLFERLSSGPRSTAPGASPMAPAPTASLSLEHHWDTSVPHSPTNRLAMTADVKIQHSPILNYWLVTIVSKDRNKLFFDTVCTFADLNYDVYHSTIDSEGDTASQLFYIRPRYGEAIWDAQRAHKLKYMLESAVQRRFPKGVKIHVQATDQRALLDLFQQLSMAGFWVTRAEVRCHHDVVVYSFSVTDNTGQIPTHAVLQRTCEMAGGHMVEDLDSMGGTLQVPAGVGPAAAAAAAALMAAGVGVAGGMSRSETLRHLPGGAGATGIAASLTYKLPGGCRFAFSFMDRRSGTGGGSNKG